MSDFKVIETQEQLEEVLKDRLGREKKKHSEELQTLQSRITELEGQNEQLTKDAEKYATYDTEIEGLKAKVTEYENAAEKRKIAKEYGLPDEMTSRLRGENADEWKADAEALKKFFRAQNVPPLAESNGSGGGDEKEEYREMLRKMKGE